MLSQIKAVIFDLDGTLVDSMGLWKDIDIEFLGERGITYEDDLQEKIHIDVPMPVSYVSFGLVEELELLEPFGTGNPKPVFAQKDLKFVSARALGKAGNVLRFTVEDSEQKRWEMMYFGGKDNFEAYAAEKYGQTALDGLYSGKGSPLYFDVVYYPGVNTWQGNTKLQLVMQQYR